MSFFSVLTGGVGAIFGGVPGLIAGAVAGKATENTLSGAGGPAPSAGPQGSAATYNLSATTQEFLEAGKKSGKWFSMPDEVRQKTKQMGDEVDRRRIRIESWMDQLNALLARTDLTDSEKRALLSELFTGSGDGLDDDKPSSIGKIISAVAAKDWPALEELFKGGGKSLFFWGGSDLDDGHLAKLHEKFNDTVTKWKQQNNIQRPPDTAWVKKWKADQQKAADYRRQLSGQSEARVARLRDEQALQANRRA